jgi:hypothetical protein
MGVFVNELRTDAVNGVSEPLHADGMVESRVEAEMTASFGAFAQEVLEALSSDERRIYLVDGSDGSGLTHLLLGLRRSLGENRCQYLDFERVATTPERFARAVVESSPFLDTSSTASSAPRSPREAFLSALSFLSAARTPDGEPAIFLMDEAVEVRTFENFPGLRTVASEFIAALAESPNRFVLTTRFGHRARRLLRGAPGRYVAASIPPLASDEIARALDGAAPHQIIPFDVADTVQRLTGGRPAYVRALGTAMAGLGPADPVTALVAQMSPGGELHGQLRYAYEVRLHRARGYGALKAILDVLAQQQPLTLTEISLRLQRTPGSTKDYLSWLEDVDLVSVEKKRYSFRDPLLRLWVQLHYRPNPVNETELAEAVRAFAAHALTTSTAHAVASPGPAGRPADGRPRPMGTGIIEID